MAKVLGVLVFVLGLYLASVGAYQIAVPASVGPGGARMTVSWAADTTCGYGFTAVDCWASNESLSLNGPALTVTVKLDVIKAGGGAINPDDISFTLTVKNEGPPIYAFGEEQPQPVYAQVTSVDTIVSDQGVPLLMVQVNSLDQELLAFRDFADNSFITERSQALLGTLLSGASDTAKLTIQLRYQAFDAANVAVGQNYYIRGFVGQQSFTISVYIATSA